MSLTNANKSKSSAFEYDHDVIKMLIDTCYMAIMQGNLVDGQMILAGIPHNEKTRDALTVAKALIAISVGDFDGAASSFEHEMREDKGDQIADSNLSHAFLGLIHHLKGNTTLKNEHLSQVKDSGEGAEVIVELSKSLMAASMGSKEEKNA